MRRGAWENWSNFTKWDCRWNGNSQCRWYRRVGAERRKWDETGAVKRWWETGGVIEKRTRRCKENYQQPGRRVDKIRNLTRHAVKGSFSKLINQLSPMFYFHVCNSCFSMAPDSPAIPISPGRRSDWQGWWFRRAGSTPSPLSPLLGDLRSKHESTASRHKQDSSPLRAHGADRKEESVFVPRGINTTRRLDLQKTTAQSSVKSRQLTRPPHVNKPPSPVQQTSLANESATYHCNVRSSHWFTVDVEDDWATLYCIQKLNHGKKENNKPPSFEDGLDQRLWESWRHLLNLYFDLFWVNLLSCYMSQ